GARGGVRGVRRGGGGAGGFSPRNGPAPPPADRSTRPPPPNRAGARHRLPRGPSRGRRRRPPLPPQAQPMAARGTGPCCQLPGVEDGGTGAGCGGRTTTSLASFVPLTTGPPTQTGVPVVSSLLLTFPWRSRTTVVLTRSQVQVVPSLALTVTDFPALTDWITPRSNASVLMPLRVCSVNWPSTPRSRKNLRMWQRARRQCAAPAPVRRASLRAPARCAAPAARRALAPPGAFPPGPAPAPAAPPPRP